MKFYNPFKIHIIVNGYGIYILRRLTRQGWRYVLYHRVYFKDVSWVKLSHRASKFDSKEDAKATMKEILRIDKEYHDEKNKANTWRKV